jgi:hypothetical protein
MRVHPARILPALGISLLPLSSRAKALPASDSYFRAVRHRSDGGQTWAFSANSIFFGSVLAAMNNPQAGQ